MCARAKSGPGLARSALCQSVTGAPLDRVVIDIVEPLPITGDGNEDLVIILQNGQKLMQFLIKPH